jgi:hypothetical protein
MSVKNIRNPWLRRGILVAAIPFMAVEIVIYVLTVSLYEVLSDSSGAWFSAWRGSEN